MDTSIEELAAESFSESESSPTKSQIMHTSYTSNQDEERSRDEDAEEEEGEEEEGEDEDEDVSVGDIFVLWSFLGRILILVQPVTGVGDYIVSKSN